MLAEIIVHADFAGVFCVLPHAALGKIGIKRTQMRRLEPAQLDVSDSGVNAREHALIAGIGARAQIVFSVGKPERGKL